jgi:hypothetical protein
MPKPNRFTGTPALVATHRYCFGEVYRHPCSEQNDLQSCRRCHLSKVIQCGGLRCTTGTQSDGSAQLIRSSELSGIAPQEARMTPASSAAEEEIVNTIALPNAVHAKMAKGPGKLGTVVFGVALAVGIAYAAIHLVGDLLNVHATSYFPFVLLGIALLVALGFEFVNGFHDTPDSFWHRFAEILVLDF